LTRRHLGWAYLGVVAVVAAAWPLSKLSSALAARSLAKLTPAPVATIDEPAPNAAVVGLAQTIKGRVVHETIRAPLWLLMSEAGDAWQAEGQIATGSGAWQREVWLPGRKGTRYRLAVVAAEIPLHNDLQHPKKKEEPPWMRDSELAREASWRAAERWWTAPLGDGTYPPLPEGARLVTSVDVVQSQDDPPHPSPYIIFLPSQKHR
jgi:hypothetical protein